MKLSDFLPQLRAGRIVYAINKWGVKYFVNLCKCVDYYGDEYEAVQLEREGKKFSPVRPELTSFRHIVVA